MSFEWGIDANRRESVGQEVRRRIRRRRRSGGRSPRERVAELQPACPVLSCHTALRVERRCKRGFLP